MAAAFAGCLLLSPLRVAAQDDERQYKIEAAYLYNFFNYISWPGVNTPQDLHEPVICIAEHDPVEPYLSYIQRRRNAEHQISIRLITPASPLDGCQIIFLRNQLPDENGFTRAVNGAVIISEKQDSVDHGAMIELFRDDENIRMKINQALLEKNGFRVSSRMLSLAEELRK